MEGVSTEPASDVALDSLPELLTFIDTSVLGRAVCPMSCVSRRPGEVRGLTEFEAFTAGQWATIELVVCVEWLSDLGRCLNSRIKAPDVLGPVEVETSAEVDVCRRCRSGTCGAGASPRCSGDSRGRSSPHPCSVPSPAPATLY